MLMMRSTVDEDGRVLRVRIDRHPTSTGATLSLQKLVDDAKW